MGDREKALSDAYWKLREHASGYRSAKVFQDAMDALPGRPSRCREVPPRHEPRVVLDEARACRVICARRASAPVHQVRR